MRSRRLASLALVGVVGLSACGAGSDGDTQQPTTELPAPTVADSSSEATEPSTPPTEPVSGEPAASVEAEAPSTDTAATEAAPASEPPVETDAEPTPAPAEIGGRPLGADLRPDADFPGNPLPSLTVRDIGRDTDVNIRNILPSDRPVLLWTWAPH